MANKAIGVDIGGTKINIALVDSSDGILKLRSIPTLADKGGQNIVDRIVVEIQKILKFEKNIQGIGVGTAGQIDQKGVIQSATATFKDWIGFPLKESLEKATKQTCLIINDVQAMALGELHYGKSYDNMIALAMGTGVGGAIIQQGQLVRGFTGAAGEIGHLILHPYGRPCPCGQKGCIEAYLSGPALEKSYREYSGHFKSGKDIFKDNDRIAKKVVKEHQDNLILALTSLTNIFSPEAIVLSGGVAGSLSEDLSHIESRLRSEVLAINKNIKIERSELLAEAMVLGAASLFF